MPTNGHPQQNAVASQRSPADAWRGIVALLKQGHSPVDVSGLSRSKAVLEVDAIIRAVAESDPYEFDTDGYSRCYYCKTYRESRTDSTHAPTCVWQRARDFVDKETK